MKTSETDSILAQIATMSAADREAQLIAACRRLEQQRDGFARQFRKAKETIAEYEEQWVDEHI